MSMRLRTARIVCALFFGLSLAPASAWSAELDAVKALYAEASYEAALQALDRLPATEIRAPEAQQYRVLCLLALGKTTEAQRAAEALIAATPTDIPSAEEFPPRFMGLFNETRRRMLPAIVTRAFDEARELYKTNKAAEASAQFERVLALSADPMFANSTEIDTMRTLASGFVELLRGQAAVHAAAAKPATPPAAAAPPVAKALVASVAIRQNLPPWVAPDRLAASREWSGSVKVVIGTDGRVKSASMIRRMHPSYEQVLLAATRNWLYKPATMGGQPVESERVLEVQLKPSTPGAQLN